MLPKNSFVDKILPSNLKKKKLKMKLKLEKFNQMKSDIVQIF